MGIVSKEGEVPNLPKTKAAMIPNRIGLNEAQIVVIFFPITYGTRQVHEILIAMNAIDAPQV